MAAGSIVIDLLLKTGAFEGDTKRAQKSWENFTGGVKAGAAVLGAAVVAAGAATTAFAVSIANQGRELQNMANLSSAGVVEFQKWSVAAKTVGIEQEKLGDIFKDTQDKIGDYIATGGGELKEFFEEIAPKVGLTAQEMAKLSGPQALGAFYNALEKSGKSQKEIVFYMESIADEATALQPLLANNGAELKRLGEEAEVAGRIMSQETVAAAAELKMHMDELGGVTDILRNKIAEAFLPVLNDMIDAIMNGDGATQGLTGSVNELAQNNSMISWFEAAGSNAAKFVDILNAVKEAVIAVGKTVGMLAIDINLAATAKDLLNPLMGMEERIKRTQELVAKFDARQAEWAKTKEQYNKDWLTWDVSNAYEKNASQRRLISGNSNNSLAKSAETGIAKMTAEANRAAASQSLLTRETEKATKAKEKEVKQLEAAYLNPYSGKFRISSEMQGSRTTTIGGKTITRAHAGVDVAMPTGTELKAMTSGIVTLSKVMGGYGNAVKIKHDDGTQTLYGHLSKMLVKEGQRVNAGQTVALSGNTGRSSGPHAHIEAWDKGGNLVDFRNMVGKKTINKVGEQSKYLELVEQEKDLALEYNTAMYERLAMLGKETELQKLNAEIELGKYDSVEPERIKEMQQMAEKYDSAIKLNEQQERANALIEEATGGNAIKSYYQDMSLLSDAFKNGKINAEQYTLALSQLEQSKPKQLNDGFESLREWIRQTEEQSVNIGDTLVNSFSSAADALAEFVATGKMDFGNLIQSMIADLARLAANKAMAGIAEGVMNAFSGGFGAPSVSDTYASGATYGSWAQFPEYDTGGYTGNGGKYEPAGIVHRGEYVFTKEETARIGAAKLAQIARNGYANGGLVGGSVKTGGDVNVTVNNNAGAQVETRETRDDQGNINIEVMIEQAVSRSIAKGGAVGKSIQSAYGLNRKAR